jgi:hypothetical protein
VGFVLPKPEGTVFGADFMDLLSSFGIDADLGIVVLVLTILICLYGIFLGVMAFKFRENLAKGFYLTKLGVILIFLMPVVLFASLQSIQIVIANFETNELNSIIIRILSIVFNLLFATSVVMPALFIAGAAKNSESGKQLIHSAAVSLFILPVLSVIIFAHIWISRIDSVGIAWIFVCVLRVVVSEFGTRIAMLGIKNRTNIDMGYFLTKRGALYVIGELIILLTLAQISRAMGGANFALGMFMLFSMLLYFVVPALFISGALKNSSTVLSVSRTVEHETNCPHCEEPFDAEMKSCPFCGTLNGLLAEA